MFEDIIADIISNLDYDNIEYKIENENGKTIIEIINSDINGRITLENICK